MSWDWGLGVEVRILKSGAFPILNVVCDEIPQVENADSQVGNVLAIESDRLGKLLRS